MSWEGEAPAEPLRRIRAVCLCLILALALFAQAQAARITKQLAPGVTFSQDINPGPGCALIVNAVTVDLGNPSARLAAAIGQDVILTEGWQRGRETISSLTARKGALVGVNADYFPFTGDPLGLCIVNGELVSEPLLDRAVMGILKNGSVFFDNPRMSAKLTLASGMSRQIDGINRGRETNQVVCYTESFGASTRTEYKSTEVLLASTDLPVRIGKPIGATVMKVVLDTMNTPIPKGGMVLSGGGPAAYFLKESLKPGDKVTLRFDINSDVCLDWTRVEQAVGGGPWLVKKGTESVDWSEEGFKESFSTATHPRTAVGVTADNKLLIVTVDGRQAISGGISLPNLAALMKRLGAVNAINLDGGGSTTLSVRGMVLNSPSEGIERPVANALLVFSDAPSVEELPKLAISGMEEQVASGEGTQLFVTWGDDAQMLTHDQLDRVVWGATNGIGFINQQGFFIPIKARKGTIEALYGSQTVSLDVSVIAGPPASLDLAVDLDKQDPLKSAVRVTVKDSNGNLVIGGQVVLEVIGGKADAANGVTSETGEFSTFITWDANAAERTVKATVGEVSASKALKKGTGERTVPYNL